MTIKSKAKYERFKQPLQAPGKFEHAFDHVKFNHKVAAQLLDFIVEGDSIQEACAKTKPRVTRGTVWLWTLRDPDFARGLDVAQRVRWLGIADTAWAIANGVATKGRGKGDDVKRDALRLRTLQWLLPRVLPDHYGLLAGQDALEAPAEAPGWLKLCSPKTQLEVATALAKAKAEGQSRVMLERPNDAMVYDDAEADTQDYAPEHSELFNVGRRKPARDLGPNLGPTRQGVK